MPYYTPYYIGYCPHRLHQQKPPPYGSDGWGQGPMPNPNGPSKLPLNFGVYTSVLQDDTIFWNMGGNGLVPYGVPRPPHAGSPDLVDRIQDTRGGGGLCAPSPGGFPVTAWSGAAAPTMTPPAQMPVEEGGPESDKEESKKSAPAETPPMEEKPAPPE